MQDQWTGKIGDKDPVDVCEIGTLPRPTGTVVPVRFLLYFNPSILYDCLHVCLNVSLILMLVYSSVCPDDSSF